MKVILCPVGSAGDVHPFVGLALAMKQRGHEVALVTCDYFQDLVEHAGLGFVPLGTKEEYLQLTEHPDLWNPLRAFSCLCRNAIAPMMRDQYRIIQERYTPGDTLVISSALGFGARMAQEKLGVSLATVHLQPAALWSDYASPRLPWMLTGPKVPTWLKRAQFRLGIRCLVDPSVRRITDEFRRELKLPPIHRTTDWWISPQLVLGLFPDWFAPLQPDWPKQVRLADFPLWDESPASPVEESVEAFLTAGPAPVVFTPGSAMRRGRSFFQAATAACERLQMRGILLTRFPENLPDRLPSTVRHFPYVPLGRLLSRCAAIAHHGGIGTTSQGLAAGVPQLVMPMAYDQLDNAERLKRLGVGDWLSPARFRGQRVAERLKRLLASSQTARRCTEVAAEMSSGAGIPAACDLLEQMCREG